MDIQLFVVVLLFALAVIYMTKRIWMQFKGKKKSGCEKCGIDVKNSVK